jgi:hypothetical protein
MTAAMVESRQPSEGETVRTHGRDAGAPQAELRQRRPTPKSTDTVRAPISNTSGTQAEADLR